MKRFAFASLAAVLILAACVDEPDTSRITTAPKSPRAAAQVGSGASTVCTGYTKELTSTKTALQAAPDDAELQIKVGSLDAMIADACQ